MSRNWNSVFVNIVRTAGVVSGFPKGRGDVRIYIYLSYRERGKTLVRDWSLITGRGGLQSETIAGPKHFAAS